MTVRTYTQITTGKTPRASVYPFEITGPPCEDCIMTITHSATFSFYEERDRSAAGWPNVSPMQFLKDCDWKQRRNDLVFQSLAGGVCMALELSDKSSKRTFKLEKLSYGYYNEEDKITRAIDHDYLFDATNKNKIVHSDFMDYHRWDVDTNMLVIRLKILNLGQVKLCKLSEPYDPKVCDGVTAGEAGSDASDLSSYIAGHLSADSEFLDTVSPATRRHLTAQADKVVVQQYVSEDTYKGKPDPKEGAAGPGGSSGTTTDSGSEGFMAKLKKKKLLA